MGVAVDELGVLPFGTGNDFARGIGLPEDDEGLVNVLTGGKSRLIDAGMAGDGFFATCFPALS